MSSAAAAAASFSSSSAQPSVRGIRSQAVPGEGQQSASPFSETDYDNYNYQDSDNDTTADDPEVQIAKLRLIFTTLQKRIEEFEGREQTTILKFSSKLLKATGPKATQRIRNAAVVALQKVRKEKDPIMKMFSATHCCLSKLVGLNQVEDPIIVASRNRMSLDISPDDTNPKHNLLVQLLEIDTIPVHDLVTKEINYDNLRLVLFEDAPELEIDLTKVKESHQLGVVIATTLTKFLRRFYKFYIGQLTECLFDDLAWKYMERALVKAEVDERYSRLIILPKYGNRNWDQAQACFYDIFVSENIKSDFRKQLYTIMPAPKEDAYDYGDRIEVLLSASGVNEQDPGLIANVLSSFPPAGQEKIRSHFKDIKLIKSVRSILNFLTTYPSVMEGQAMDIYAWHTTKYGKPTYKVQADTKAGSSAGHFYQRIGQKRKRNSDRGSAKCKQACTEPPAKKPTVKAVGSCRSYFCNKYKRNLSHTDAKCFRHSDENKFKKMNQRAQEREQRRVANIKRTQRGNAQK
ncbi:hypothetical protein BGZ76_002204 [Entomortierella beljakovae]|nr:hypothetical protein BGZ76_002204 [Entomortierella beljakovae]